MRHVARVAFWVLAAAALAMPVAMTGPTTADAAVPAGLGNAVVMKLIRELHAGETPTRRFKFESIRIAKPHVAGIAEIYGIKGGTKVWPVLATFTIFTSGGGSITAASSTCGREDQTQFFYFYRNAMGDWTDGQYASSENKDVQSHPYGPCSTMPGSAIFNTPLPAGASG